MTAAKKGGVEIVAGDKDEEVEIEEGKTADGPTSGEDAPLFGVLPDLKCSFGFEKDEVFVRFSRATSEVEYDKTEAEFLVSMLATHARFMPATRRGKADAVGDNIDVGAKFSIRRGKLIIKFPESKSVPWRMSKLAAKKAVLEMRAELIGLPRIAD